MNLKQLQNIKLTSLSTVQSLYMQDYSAVLPLLHPDVTWIDSSDNQFRQGKSAVTEFLSAGPSLSACPSFFTGPPAAQPDILNCQLLYSDLESCSVLCSCSSRHRQEYCVTLLWRICREGPRICHIHASQSPALPDSVLTVIGRRAECFYLKPDDILYVEADNICTCVVCFSRTFEARQSISDLRNALPGYFLQIHRSFLVNCHHISGLRRYTLELSSGAQLPIPEKKYKWLKEYLKQYRQG